MTHRILSERDIPGLENVANLDGLPATGATVVALPMKIEGGSGGPLRIVAFVPNGSTCGGPLMASKPLSWTSLPGNGQSLFVRQGNYAK